MTTYKATRDHLVRVYGGEVKVQTGELVNWAVDPGEGWEEVRKHGSDSGKARGTVGSKRRGNGDDGGGV